MNTSLKFFALFFAVALPGTVAAEFAGFSLPASVDSMHVFSAFVVALVLLTVVSDYSVAARTRRTAVTAPLAKAAHPLAA
jgi:hypothetical protein